MSETANNSTNYLKQKLMALGVLVLASQTLLGQVAPAPRASQMQAATKSSSDGAAVIELAIPSDVQLDTLSAALNGKDVTGAFTRVTCAGGLCEDATFTTQDGLHDNKNALSVVARRTDGTLISVRHRFGLDQVVATRASAPSSLNLHANAVGALPTLSNFLPPAVAFNTLQYGGYNINNPWFQVGSQNTYPSVPAAFLCGGTNLYTVIVLDRQTLMEKTAAPESSPQCIPNGSALKTYLATLTSSDLVIVGSNAYVNSDASAGAAKLDTSAIGGKAYNCTFCTFLPSTTMQSQDIPMGYMAIGVGGAASGSAFENYYTAGTLWFQSIPFATGMLIEDVNGNYNFQASGTVEYTITPNDPTNSNVATIQVDTLPGDPYFVKGILHKVYRPPVNPSQGGFWLLVLQQSTLFSIPFDLPSPPPTTYSDACPQSVLSSDGKTAYFNSCGQFYNTNVSSATAAATQYTYLQADLEAIGPNELTFLVTIGTAGYPDTNGIKLIPTALGGAFSNLGGTPETLKGLNLSGSTYSFVGCRGCGNSLGGHTVISTNQQPSQGQNGYIHGLLQPNLNGLYWPTQASLDQPGTTGAATADFTIQEVTSVQPVDWPALSTTTKLPGPNGVSADSTAGQNAAYYYVSNQLITQYYILGAQGSHIDDIHYYFTGGNNTFLDYHTFDPAKLPFPGSTPASCYQWTSPVVTRGTLSCFTQNDFNAVAAQMHNEILYLTNVLQFMVTGSTNMKDLVASGNGSAALALINAAASVKASTLQPPFATPIKSNVSSILNLVGNVVSVAAAIATGGLSTSALAAAKDAVTIIGPTASVITGSFGIASSVTGGLHTAGGASPIPSPNYNFETTIGELSSNTLQQKFTAGFDTGLDTILGDWYKLSIIGPKITDTDQPGFQAATQVAQVVSAIQIGQASQRSFYMALLPITYSVQHYTYFFGQFGATNNPDMGARTDDDPAHCNTWYYSGPVPSNITQVSRSYFSYADGGPTKFSFTYYDGVNVTIPAPVDWYVIANQTPTDKGKSNQNLQALDAQVAFTLFDPTQLNLPFDAFVDQGGPMASAWADTSTSGFDGFPANQTCSFYSAGKYGGSVSSGVSTVTRNPVTIKVNVPTAGVLGDNVTLQATAFTGTLPVTAGFISFQDGTSELRRTALDTTGTATLTLNTLALGSHSIVAYFVATSQYTASQSTAGTVTIYSSVPDLVLSPSAASLAVSHGGTSSPLNLQVTSKWGLAGPVTFTCSGLPTRATCAFTPSTVTLTSGSTASTVLTVSSSTQKAEVASSLRIFAAFLLPLQLLWLRRKRRAIQSLCSVLLMGTLLSLGFVTGCASTAPAQAATTGTILVTATSGSLSRSMPITLNVQ